MTKSHKDILIGGLAALICAAVIIYAIEAKSSFWHLFTGFLIFVIPFTFLSVFRSKVGSFVFVFFTALTTYIVSKFFFYDFWLGVLLAAIIGGSAFYFKVRTYKPFSPGDYRQKAEEKHKNRK